MPQIPAAPENDYLWHCPLCHEPSVANEYDGETLVLRCPNGHEWTWDGTWLEWDVPGRGEQE